MLALLVVLAGAAARADTRRELHVSVAVSLLPAVREAAAEFENRHPGVSVRLNSGASAVLLQQIRRGAPADLFLSASPLEIDRLESLVGLRPGSRRTLASNRLVIVVPPGRAPPTDPRQLASQEFDLVAVGNPRTSPLGRYTAEALAALELDDTLAPRLVHGESARRVLDYVTRGEVAAGLV